MPHQDRPAFISINGYAAADGSGLAVVRFESEEALQAWKTDLDACCSYHADPRSPDVDSRRGIKPPERFGESHKEIVAVISRAESLRSR